MIIGKMLGGLGNQMFQYAATRSLALDRCVSYSLDIAQFSKYKLHQGFELNSIFDCNSPLATQFDIKNVLGWQSNKIVRQCIEYPALSRFRLSSWVKEPYFKYWKGFYDAPSNCYLEGYWQSEKYFVNVKDVIREDFRFRLTMSPKNAFLAKKIEESNAISLHVRRGDYVSNRCANEVHGVCSIEYYKKAIKYIAEKIANPKFFVFSDDMDWVRENIDIGYPNVLIDHNNGFESYNDMRLMSMCQHHIVANSTFSWWGAWLNPSLEKVVIAPRKWFAQGKDASDLIPDNWITI